MTDRRTQDTTTVWLPEESDLQERIEARYDSNSAAFREGAELLMAVDDIYERFDIDPDSVSADEKRRAVTSALITAFKRD